MLGGAPRYPWEGTDRDYNYDEVLLLLYISPHLFSSFHYFLVQTTHYSVIFW